MCSTPFPPDIIVSVSRRERERYREEGRKREEGGGKREKERKGGRDTQQNEKEREDTQRRARERRQSERELYIKIKCDARPSIGRLFLQPNFGKLNFYFSNWLSDYLRFM